MSCKELRNQYELYRLGVLNVSLRADPPACLFPKG